MVEELHQNATWEDLMYNIYVHLTNEAGLKDSEAGRTIDVKELRVKLGKMIKK